MYFLDFTMQGLGETWVPESDSPALTEKAVHGCNPRTSRGRGGGAERWITRASLLVSQLSQNGKLLAQRQILSQSRQG